jgi:hypothetical protein
MESADEEVPNQTIKVASILAEQNAEAIAQALAGFIREKSEVG